MIGGYDNVGPRFPRRRRRGHRRLPAGADGSEFIFTHHVIRGVPGPNAPDTTALVLSMLSAGCTTTT